MELKEKGAAGSAFSAHLLGVFASFGSLDMFNAI